jgi:hypothetical protein
MAAEHWSAPTIESGVFAAGKARNPAVAKCSSSVVPCRGSFFCGFAWHSITSECQPAVNTNASKLNEVLGKTQEPLIVARSGVLSDYVLTIYKCQVGIRAKGREKWLRRCLEGNFLAMVASRESAECVPRLFFSGFSGQIYPAQAGSEFFFAADLDHEDPQTMGTSEYGVMRCGALKVVESVVESSRRVGCYLIWLFRKPHIGARSYLRIRR